MDQLLQNIIFPQNSELEGDYKLFYLGGCGIYEMEQKKLHLADSTVTDFCSYMNSFSLIKWKEYTAVGSVRLTLGLSGRGQVELVGYHLNVHSPVRRTFGLYDFDFTDKKELEIPFPENEEMVIGFEIRAISHVTVYGGAWYGTYDPKQKKDVILSVATTTMKKEDFITRNMASLKREILDADDDMKEHFYIHVVDNGRTLDAEAMSSWHLTVHPNKNTGGSGGYARGMIEAMEQDPPATHVLLMDDDVTIQPESIRRTYQLLSFLRDEYRDSFISGAMLLYEEMRLQYEDVGAIRDACTLTTLKGIFDMTEKRNLLRNEEEPCGYGHRYAGWWYCCIPTHMIREKGLPLPLFIRFDDVEFGLRCKPKFVTMNGICIWHMGFAGKYNLAMDRYQMCRNPLVVDAVGSMPGTVNAPDYVRKAFRSELLKFNYNAAELILRAFKDFLRGPEFFQIDQGEEIIKENVQKNEKYQPMNGWPDIEVNFDEILEDFDRKPLETFWYRLTFNGQRLWPFRAPKRGMIPVFFSDVYQPGRYVGHDAMLAVNVDNRTAVERHMDKDKYRSLKKEWDQAYRYYRRNRASIVKSYRDAQPYLVSVEFWKKYLEI